MMTHRRRLGPGLACVALGLLLVGAPQIAVQQPRPLAITFLANAGVLLSPGDSSAIVPYWFITGALVLTQSLQTLSF